MAKQNQPKQPEQQQGAGQKGNNPSQQGGRAAPGQPGNNPNSPGQSGARQSDAGSGRESSAGQQGSQREKTSNQFGTGGDTDDSPEMNQAGERADENSSEKLRRGALDAQYGTDSSKAGQQVNRPQGSGGAGSTRSGESDASTGSDRDTMGGARDKGR